MQSTPNDSELGRMGPVARMMMSVAAHAITSYVQFRALAEVLIARGLITREELETHFAQMREQELERTIDEWFTPDIAMHVKMAIRSEAASESEAGAESLSGEAEDLARARRMQGGVDAAPLEE